MNCFKMNHFIYLWICEASSNKINGNDWSNQIGIWKYWFLRRGQNWSLGEWMGRK